jgi:tripartite-type tricarboxylate transporter receptor subunit TctC
MRIVCKTIGLMLTIGLLFSLNVTAQTYPSKPIKVIVPYPPGGGTDVLTRLLTTQLLATNGETFFIDNRPGGDATIGAALAAKSAPDGYTLLAVSGVPFVINQLVFSKLPYKILEDFEPVGLFASGPLVLVVHSSFPANTGKELIELLKNNPDKYSYAGSDQFTYLTMEMILNSTGTKMTHVPYKGVGPSLNDVAGGHIPIMLSSLAPAIPFIQGKRVKALLVTSATRTPALPDVPTVAESIIPGYDVNAWYGVFAPKGTPSQVVMQLSQSINKATEGADIRKNLANLGTVTVRAEPEPFRNFLRAELEKWRGVVKATNIPVQ